MSSVQHPPTSRRSSQPKNGTHPPAEWWESAPRVEYITPERAATMLQRNTQDRPLRERRVESYSAQMSAGLWQLTPYPIAFDENGDLVDGQHRLTAVMRSGMTVPFFVQYGVPRKIQDVIDIGATRTARDLIALRGHGQTAARAAATRVLIAYEHSETPFRWLGDSRNQHLLTPAAIAIKQDELTDELTVAVAHANQLRAAGIRGGAGFWSALFVLMERKGSEDLRGFINALVVGEALTGPLLVLRNYLFKASGSGRQRNDAEFTAAIITKAWNAYRDPRRHVFSIAAWRVGGPTPEPFPLPI